MIGYLFNLIVYQPLYNGLILLMDLIPWVDAGVSVIIFTIIVKLALFPLSQKATKTQLKLKELESDIALLKEKHKDDKEAHARATLAFYKENNVNPFSTLFIALIQIPIILALYYVFSKGLPEIKTDLLYSFVSVPEVKMHLFGFVDITKGSFWLAVLVAVSQYFQVHFSMPTPKPTQGPRTLTDDFAKSLHIQMKYILPVIVGIIAYKISGAVSLYWITSNLFAIGQELYIRKLYFRKA